MIISNKITQFNSKNSFKKRQNNDGYGMKYQQRRLGNKNQECCTYFRVMCGINQQQQETEQTNIERRNEEFAASSALACCYYCIPSAARNPRVHVEWKLLHDRGGIGRVVHQRHRVLLQLSLQIAQRERERKRKRKRDREEGNSVEWKRCYCVGSRFDSLTDDDFKTIKS